MEEESAVDSDGMKETRKRPCDRVFVFSSSMTTVAEKVVLFRFVFYFFCNRSFHYYRSATPARLSGGCLLGGISVLFNYLRAHIPSMANKKAIQSHLGPRKEWKG